MTISSSIRGLRQLAVLLLVTTAAAVCQAAPAKLTELRVDYAYYSPSSLVLKHFGWLEQQFPGVSVKWVLSAGSNRALEYLNSGSVDFSSTAGLAAVLSRANGNPVKAVYIYSRPEWTALVLPKGSPIHSLKDLKGKKVAATTGTDPYLFLLRALHDAGLRKSDIEHVNLQHADGRTALEQGRVDAWAGLDPHMAASQLESGSTLLYRNVAYNTYGFLNTTDTFAAQHPEAIQGVIEAYERARKWIIAHPQETAALLSQESHISLAVAQLQLTRNDFSQPVPGPEHIHALQAAAPILVEEELVKPGADVNQAIGALIDPRYARAAVH